MTGRATPDDCFFVGPFPPPIHGQAVATERLAQALQREGIRLDRRDSAGSLLSRVFRQLGYFAALAVAPERSVYLSANANTGLLFTAILAGMVRLRRKRLVIHHHSYRYIARHDALAALLVRVAGERAVHVTNCPRMAAELAERYPRLRRTSSLSNVGFVSRTLRPAARPERPVAVGHMSNLSEAKGVGRVVDAVAALRREGMPVRLELAGPASEPFAQEVLARARAEFGDAFHYHGPVSGDRKQTFFDAIDVFAFPSLYATETQGIVNLEALACGKPVVAYAQCCIAPDIGTTGGIAVPRGADFSAALARLVRDFEGAPEALAGRARQRFETLKETFDKEFHELAALLR